MKVPSLEEVREHFKDAKSIEVPHTTKVKCVDVNDKIIKMEDCYALNFHLYSWVTLWSKDDGYAKIIEYKEKENRNPRTKSFYIEVAEGMEVDVLTFKKIEKELPNSWVDYIRHFSCSGAIIEFRETPKHHQALRKLELLRDCYNDGWVAEFSDYLRTKFCIYLDDSNICSGNYTRKHHFLNFKTADLRDKFLKNFSEIINIAKPLL